VAVENVFIPSRNLIMLYMAHSNELHLTCACLHFLPAQHDLGRNSQHHPQKHQIAHSSMSDLTATGDIRREFREFKRHVQDELNSMNGELAIVKNCIMQLYNVLLPGKFTALGEAGCGGPGQPHPQPGQVPGGQPLPPAAPSRTPPLPHPSAHHPSYPQVCAAPRRCRNSILHCVLC
jgi:hypothetical protein